MEWLTKTLFILAIHIVGLTRAQPNPLLINSTQILSCFNDPISVNESIEDIENVSKRLVDGSRSFGFNLFKTLYTFNSESNGLFLSPSSVWSTLMLAYFGSHGDTQQELSDNLKLNKLPKSSVALAFQSISLWSQIKSELKSENVLSAANKLFVSDSLKLNSCFHRLFHDQIQNMNFVNDPTASLLHINEWVQNRTKGLFCLVFKK